jgi:hypothetical protein
MEESSQLKCVHSELKRQNCFANPFAMKVAPMKHVPQVLLAYMCGLESLDVAKVASTLAEEVEIILPTRKLSKKAFLSYLTALYAAFPDWRYQHDEPEIHADGIIAIRWSQGGTHLEKWVLPGSSPIVPTGKAIQIPLQLFMYRLAHDKIIEIRPEPIQGGVPQAIFEQIGATDSVL